MRLNAHISRAADPEGIRHMDGPDRSAFREPKHGRAAGRWIDVLDWITVGAIGSFLVTLVSGGFTVNLGPLRISNHSIIRPIVLAGVLVLVRRLTTSAPGVHKRFSLAMRHLDSRAPLSILLLAFLSRCTVLLVGLFAVITIGTVDRPIGAAPMRPLADLPSRFDANWYMGIATEGYRFLDTFEAQQNIAFFPAFPMLARAGGHLFGAFDSRLPPFRRNARVLWVGTLLSIAAFVWACFYLLRTSRLLMGEDTGPLAVSLLASYPFAVFFSAAYTESLFLLTSIAAFYHFRKHEWLAAGLWALAAGLTRPNGCLLTVVLLCSMAEEVVVNGRIAIASDYRVGRAVVTALMPAVSMMAYSLYTYYLTDALFGWVYVQSAWGRSFGFPDIWRIVTAIDLGTLPQMVVQAPFDTINAMGLLFAMLMVAPVFRRLGFAAGMFMLVNIAAPFMAGGVVAMGRYTSTLFPMFIALAGIMPRGAAIPFIIASSMVQGVVAVLFFTGRPLF